MKVDFTKFPLYDGIEKKRLIASDIHKSYGDWMWKNVGGLQAHLLSENIYQFGEVELTDEDIALIRQTCNVITGLMAASITDYFDKREKEEKGNED